MKNGLTAQSDEYQRLTEPSRQVADRLMPCKEIHDGYDHRVIAMPVPRPQRDAYGH